MGSTTVGAARAGLGTLLRGRLGAIPRVDPVLFGLIVAVIGVAVAAHAAYRENLRVRFASTYHDRNAHYQAGLNVATELRQALLLVADAPEVGVRYPHPSVEGVRRLLLSGTRHHLYYVHDELGDTVEVVAVWSAVRGLGPIVRR